MVKMCFDVFHLLIVVIILEYIHIFNKVFHFVLPCNMYQIFIHINTHKHSHGKHTYRYHPPGTHQSDSIEFPIVHEV